MDGAKPYGLPADNPFRECSPKVRPEIWDLGLRNPWRFSFDRATGDLFGSATSARTPGRRSMPSRPVPAAATTAWNLLEGMHCFRSGWRARRALTLPSRSTVMIIGCSVIGGYVYRGSRSPALAGGYLYSDYCSGTIWAISAAAALANGKADPAIVGSAGFPVTSFGQGDDGELFAVDLNGRLLTVAAAAP